MRIHYSVLVAAATAATGLVNRAGAQYPFGDDHYTNVGSYSFAIPIGDTHRFTPDPSFLGLAWEGQWLVRPRTAAGLAVTFNEFYDNTRGTASFATGAVTGLQTRALMLASAMAVGRWYVHKAAYDGAYVGLGAGGQLGREYYVVGTASPFTRSAVHFVVAPELGFAHPVAEGMELVVSARYTGSSAAGNYLGGGARRFQFVTLSIGMAER